jgi:hypothetical protein
MPFDDSSPVVIQIQKTKPNTKAQCPFSFSGRVPFSLLYVWCPHRSSLAAMALLYEPDLPFATLAFLNPARSDAALSLANSGIRAHGTSSHGGSEQPSSSPPLTTVAQALELARDSAEGAEDPTVSAILEAALADIWSRIHARPSTYVMTREEFAVFNYFQHRFEGNELAISARRRYWDHLRVSGSD